MPIGWSVAIFGTLFGTSFASAVEPPLAKVAGAIAGIVFILVGLALVFKSAVERIIVDEDGILKRGAPWGKTVFQCKWADVIAYGAVSERTGGKRDYVSVLSYSLQSRGGELRFNALESYFASLHSVILSRLPERVSPKLIRTDVPKAQPIEQLEEFHSSSRTVNAAAIVGYSFIVLLLVALAFAVLFGFPDDPFPKRMAGAILFFFGAFIFALVVRSRLAGLNAAAYRVTSYGVQKRIRDDEPEIIPWKEMRSLEFVYEYYHNPRSDEGRPRLAVTPRHTYHYAILGAEGEAFEFSSRMRDFGAFVGSIVDHAPLQVAISLHTDLLAIRRGS